jgi:RNA polymerase sigma-70 factor (ECF subfamily)
VVTDASLESTIARARRECPAAAAVDDAVLADRLRAHPGALATLHAGDLLLALACVRQDGRALAELERRYAADLRAALLAADPDAAFADEVLQDVRARLLLGDAPRLTSYTGSGPLGAWLRVVALRTQISLRRGRWREVALEDSVLGASPEDLEREVARAEHRALLRTIVRDAIASQDRKMRTLLRFYYCDGAGVEELGRVYRVHASTISRWLSQTRGAILAETRRRLADALRLDSEALASMLDLVHSLEISVTGALRDPSAG